MNKKNRNFSYNPKDISQKRKIKLDDKEVGSHENKDIISKISPDETC